MDKLRSQIKEKARRVGSEIKETAKEIKGKMKEEGTIIKEHANNLKDSL